MIGAEIKNKKEIFMNISKKNKNSAMTLVEILIVISLLGLLAGVLVKSLSNTFQASKKGVAKTFLDGAGTGAVRAYIMTENKPPTNWTDLTTKKLIQKGAEIDPWGKEYSLTQVSSGTTPAAVVAVVLSCTYPQAVPAPFSTQKNSVQDVEGEITTYNSNGNGHATLIEI
jgi:prepilin-type N-terminal cleavage/methylation domain-containing protein